MRMRIRFGLACVLFWACSNDSGNSPSATEAGGGSSGTGASQAGAGGTTEPQAGMGGRSASAGNGGASGGPGNASVHLPQVYPPVRAATPTALIADASFAGQASAFQLELEPGNLGRARQALAAITLGTAIQERFYSTGPTDLLRIVKALDDRVQGLDVNGPGHACLSGPPVSVSYALPAGETFGVKLQCMQRFGTAGANAGWVAFGIVPSPSAVDAGLGSDPADASALGAADAATRSDAGVDSGADFYLIEGQEGGNGGAYHIDANGNVEGWIAVAERDLPANSQVIMHLRTQVATSTLELALAGAGVGFCAAHLKTNPGYLFVDGKTNAPPPPGTEQAVGTQYCDEPRSGCFDASDLATDLGADSASCAAIAPSSFDIDVALDADTSADSGVNVVTTEIYSYFNQMPAGIPNF
jgi:hypothetical protein